MYFNKKIFGFFCAVAAAVTFGLNPLFGLKLYENGLTPPTVLFYRFLFGSILLAIVMFCRKQSFIIGYDISIKLFLIQHRDRILCV